MCQLRKSAALTEQLDLRGFKGLRLHDLRHAHATLLLLGGVPVNAVSHRLGHSNATITLNVYSHVLRQAEDRAVSVAAECLSSALASSREHR
jgi:integrase